MNVYTVVLYYLNNITLLYKSHTIIIRTITYIIINISIPVFNTRV